MTKPQREKLRLGMDCCIRANQTHHCPPECPYKDEVTGKTVTYCEGVLLLDALRYMKELEDGRR